MEFQELMSFKSVKIVLKSPFIWLGIKMPLNVKEIQEKETDTNIFVETLLIKFLNKGKDTNKLLLSMVSTQ